jgi:hypothetical protein
MLFRLGLVLACAAACSDPECDVEDLVSRDIEGLHSIECGVIDVGFELETPELQVAHDCVQNALDSTASFYVVWRYSDFEGWVTQAYIGGATDGRVIAYSRSPAPDGREGTGQSTCSALQARDACDVGWLKQDLCFECADRESVVLCEIE